MKFSETIVEGMSSDNGTEKFRLSYSQGRTTDDEGRTTTVSARSDDGRRDYISHSDTDFLDKKIRLIFDSEQRNLIISFPVVQGRDGPTM